MQDVQGLEGLQGMESAGPSLIGLIVPGIIGVLIAVVMILAMWKIFAKAGQPGWASLVPIYNIIVLLQIVGKPVWWIILLFIPIVNFVISIILALELAKVFGKSGGFAAGLILLPVVFYPLLGFGDASYVGARR